jgi:3-dehydroquinate dehydratase-2
MPHIVIEYSEGAGNRIDIPALVKAVHRSVRDSGAVKPNAVRTFAREATHSLVADEHSANQFVQIILRICVLILFSRIPILRSTRPHCHEHSGDSKGRRMSLIYVLNGPNLSLLGKRQPHIYGHETLADVEADCRRLASELGHDIRFHQSNREYEIIDWIHEAREDGAGIVINPAAFTHTSVAILDALNTFEQPVIEVHISNVHKREAFRHHSFVSHRADGVIAGLGIEGYQLAIRRVASLITSAEKK